MVGKYFNCLFKKAQKYANKYDKFAHNPFLENDREYNPFKPLYEQTYIWIEKPVIRED